MRAINNKIVMSSQTKRNKNKKNKNKNKNKNKKQIAELLIY